jgi:hypothetical protein
LSHPHVFMPGIDAYIWRKEMGRSS